MRAIIGLVLCLGASAALVRTQTRAGGRTLALHVRVDSEHRATVVLSGRRPRTPREGERPVALYVGTWSRDSAIAIDGTYEFSDSNVVFRPYYPIVPGVEYLAVAHVGDIQLAEASATSDASAILTQRVLISADPIVSRTAVTAVYPTADTLPENLLKFYIHFSRPMRDGDAARHVALLDDRGRTISRAFLAGDTELWDRSHQRLTILLDPGRIKRGLRPNQELGAPLTAGHKYRLRIDSGWRDADGAPLIAGHEKPFIAAHANRTPLSTRDWRTVAPRPGTVDPIELHLPRPIDHALALRLIAVEDPTGATVIVTRGTADSERTIRLVPRTPWAPGTYRVLVGAEIEDVSGNNLQRLFDVDLADPAARPRDDVAAESILVRIAPSDRHPR